MQRLTSAGLLAALALLPLNGCKGRVPNFSSLTRLFHHRKSASKTNTADYAANLQNTAAMPRLNILKWSDVTALQPQVQKFYDDRDGEIAWTRDGAPTPQATRLIQLFGAAADKGLQPEDYDASRWAEHIHGLDRIHTAHDTSDTAANTIAQFDVAVTVTAMRYLGDLHLGRINPQTLDFDIDVPPVAPSSTWPPCLTTRSLMPMTSRLSPTRSSRRIRCTGTPKRRSRSTFSSPGPRPRSHQHPYRQSARPSAPAVLTPAQGRSPRGWPSKATSRRPPPASPQATPIPPSLRRQ